VSTETVQVVPGAIVACETVTEPLLATFEVLTTARPPGPVPGQFVLAFGVGAMRRPAPGVTPPKLGSVSVYETPVSVSGVGAFGSNVEISDIVSVETWPTAT
jgi:hypothetical protein